MSVLAWHFLRADGRMRGASNGDAPVKAGDVHKHDDPLVLCESGLHASHLIIDALEYAPGQICCRVECGGDIVEGEDKLVCSERRVLWVIDATRALRLFACECAKRALLREREAGREPDARSWAAIEVARAYARGEASEEEIAAASAAARAAAWEAARTAARTAASAAAREAARTAARAAARTTAWDAARAAAWEAARTAARAAAWEAAWAAASDAARAARAAERGWQEARLAEMLEEAHAEEKR